MNIVLFIVQLDRYEELAACKALASSKRLGGLAACKALASKQPIFEAW